MAAFLTLQLIISYKLQTIKFSCCRIKHSNRCSVLGKTKEEEKTCLVDFLNQYFNGHLEQRFIYACQHAQHSLSQNGSPGAPLNRQN